MSEIIDFLIELFSVFTGAGKGFSMQYASASFVPEDERGTILERFRHHLAKDPATAGLDYSHLYVVRKKDQMKVTALDDRLRRVITVRFPNFLASSWDRGKMDA